MFTREQQPKKATLRHILIGASIAFMLLAIVGFIQFNGNEVFRNIKTNASKSISELNDGWTYEIENGMSFSTSLPNNLNLPLHTKKVTLVNQLPDTVIPGGGLRFESMMVAINIYIDGELVKTYGN